MVVIFPAATVDGQSPLQFRAETAGRDAVVSGAWTALGPKFSATVGGVAIPAGQLVELHQVGQPRPPLPVDRPHLLFVNGDRWPGSVAEIKGDRVRFLPDFGVKQEVSIPLNALAVVWLSTPRPGDEPDPFDAARLTAKRPLDQVRLTNRDALNGTLVSVDRANITLDDAGRLVTAPRDRVVAIALNSDLAKATAPRGPFAHVVLATGARLTLVDAAVQDGRLIGKTPAGGTVRALLGDVVALAVRNGPAVPLGELLPVRDEHTPYLGVRWPYAVDRSTAGGPLRIAGDTFDRGIGLHSESRLTYRPPAGATRLQAWLGIDAVAGRCGRAVAGVRVDGRPRFGPTDVAGGQPARRVVVPLTPADKEVTLVVEFGPGGDVQDHVIWGEAQFVVPPT